MLEVRAADVVYRDPEDHPAREHRVVSQVSIRLHPHEIVAVVGTNGAGKTTLARVMCGSLTPDEGTALLDGKPVDFDDLRSSVGYVRQDPQSQLVATEVFEEVAFGPCNHGLPEADVCARVTEALDQCGLSGYETRLVSQLSGGECQRLALAGVLASDPKYLVLDEVTSQLDGASRAQIRAIIHGCVERGLGVMSVTHDPEEIAAADRVIMLDEGCMVWSGPPVDFFSRHDLLRQVGVLETPLGRLLALAATQGCSYGPQWNVQEFLHLLMQPPLRDQVQACLQDFIRVSSADIATDRLELSHIEVSYDETSALRDVSLCADQGRVVLIAGPSGSGKSTAAHVAAGLLEPQNGTATWQGHSIHPGQVGLCLQRSEDQLFWDTVFDDVAFGPRNLGYSSDEVSERSRAALKAVGLDEELWERSPHALSGGQRRRAALAGIVALAPGAYVFDEPTIGLDGEARSFLHALVRQLADEGHPIIVVSHDLDEWLASVDDVVLITDGRVTWSGMAQCLMSDTTPLVAAGLVAPVWVQFMEQYTQHMHDDTCKQNGQYNHDGQHEYGAQHETPRAVRRAVVTLADASASQAKRQIRSTTSSSQHTLLRFGSYRGGDTPLHRLDARVKIVLLLSVTIALFVTHQPRMLVLAALLIGVLARYGGVHASELVAGLKPAFVILAFSFLTNAFVFDGSADVALVGPLGISIEGLIRGCSAVGRIVVLVAASLLLTSTTSSTQISDGIASMLRPTRHLGVPVDDFALICSIALRFIPLTADELMRIRDAQRARGADFAARSIIVRVRRWLSVLTPLVVSLFCRADDLAAALRERGYRGEGRTQLVHALRRVDIIGAAGGIVLCIVCALA